MSRRWTPGYAVRWVVMIAAFSGGGLYEARQLSCLHNLANGDFWWHLRVGSEILQSHSLPRTAWGSQLSNAAWATPSWLYDIGVATIFRMTGLRAVVLTAILLRVALAVAIFLLGGGARGHFWFAISLSLIAQYLLQNFQPLPVYCSALALAVELVLLRRYRCDQDARALYLLPILFLVWANFDTNVAAGIALMGVFMAAESFRTRQDAATQKLLWSVFGVSLLASILTPYGWNNYIGFFADRFSAADGYLSDHLAMRFRTSQDYALLLLAMTAFLILGLRRSRDVFSIGFLVVASAAAFHANRDGWLLVVASVTVISGVEVTAAHCTDGSPRPRIQLLAGFGICAVMAGLVSLSFGVAHRQQELRAELAKSYPVAAADFIRSHNLPTPMFNTYPWGGFLMWYLPEYPVAIDSRAGLYSDDYEINYAKAMNTEEHYSVFSPLAEANTLIFEKSCNMATAIASVPGYRTVYEDTLAIVLEQERGNR